MSRWLWLPIIAAASSSLVACAPPCSTVDEDPVTFEAGATNTSGTYYETSAFDGQYLHFPGGRHYVLVHGLNAKPADITTYLAFQERPLPDSKLSESAGNQALIEGVDEKEIRVFNDTCAEFYLRLTARTEPSLPGDAGTPPVDAGAD